MVQSVISTLAACTLLTGLFAHVSSQSFKFTNPPSYDLNSGLDNNPSYKEGETMDVSWTVREEARLINLALNHVKLSGLDSADSSEIIMLSTFNTTSYSWTVTTNASLSMSNTFFLSVYSSNGDADTSIDFHIEGESGGESVVASSSVVFTASPSAVSTAPPLAQASTAASTSASERFSASSFETSVGLTSTPTSNTAIAPTSNTAIAPTSNITDAPNTPYQEIHHMHVFPVGAKIGLGIGIPAALVLGLVAGWLDFRRHRQRRRMSCEVPTDELPNNDTDKPELDNHSGHFEKDIHEAPSNHLLEIGFSDAQNNKQWGVELEDKTATVAEASPVRYEMEASTVNELHDQTVGSDKYATKTES